MKSSFVSGMFALVATSLWGGEALADAPVQVGAPVSLAPTTPPPRWYGWEILTVTTALTPLATSGLGLGFFVDAEDNPGAAAPYYVLGAVGMAGILGAGPVVHLAHGHTRRALISLGMMMGSAALGAGVGALACDNCTTFGYGMAGSLGGFSGAFLANIVDIAALSYEPVPPPDPARQSRSGGVGARVLPWIDVAGERKVFGVSGAF